MSLAMCLLLLLPFVRVGSGHPHVFIENALTFIFDKHGMAGVHVTWVFDEFFSNMIACDCDSNNNGTLETSEVKNIKEKAFRNLENFDYFTLIRIDKRPFKVKYIQEFSAELRKGKLIYRFLIPCHIRAVSGFKELIISQYDPTYYTSVAFAKNDPVGIKGASLFDTAYHMQKNPEKTFYYGQFHPLETILDNLVKSRVTPFYSAGKGFPSPAI